MNKFDDLAIELDVMNCFRELCLGITANGFYYNLSSEFGEITFPYLTMRSVFIFDDGTFACWADVLVSKKPGHKKCIML